MGGHDQHSFMTVPGIFGSVKLENSLEMKE